MKRNKYIYAALGVLFALTGCNKVLDDAPDNRTELDTPEKVQELLVSAYPDRYYIYIAEVMSDNADDKYALTPSSTLNTDMYFWRDNNELNGEDNTPTEYFMSCYEAIAAANQAIESHAELQNSAKYNYIRGEALVARAYAHFMLAYLWCKPYNPATAANDLGLAYVTTPEKVVFRNYTRISLKDYYDAIERDLTEGIPLIDNSKYTQPRFHFTTEAAHVFASRFYLMKGEWDKVIEHSTAALGSNPENKLRNIKVLNTMGGEERKVDYASPTNPANALVATAPSVVGLYLQIHKYSLSLPVLRKILVNTHPLNYVNIEWAARNSFLGTSNYYGFPKFKYFDKFVNRSAGTRIYYSSATLLSFDEAYLNRMEAYLMTENYDQFRRDLYAYLKPKTINSDFPGTGDPFSPGFFERYFTEAELDQRYEGDGTDFDPPYPLTTRQREWLQCVIDTRRVEFVQEGLRWFDNKRLGMKVIHMDDTTPMELPKDDPRRELQLPLSALEFGVTPNPR